MPHRPLPLAVALALLLPACSATGGAYPSLLPRAGEKQGFEEPAIAAPAAVAPDPALDARIAAARTRLTEAVAGFAAAASAAQRSVSTARGAAAGSEPWLNAQVALAGLDAARSATVEVASELEQITSERAVGGEADYPALTAATAEARKAVDEQSARIATLQDALPPG